jgi:enoyl-CoA hydratase/carnithine racemase
MGEFVWIEMDGAVAVIRLNRPPVNAMNERLSLELWDAAREAETNDAIRAVVIWGGDRVFSAGADVRDLVALGPREVEPIVGAIESALQHIEAAPKVVIAAVNGHALGGGCELALCADFRFAAEDANFGLPEVKLGIVPGAGGTQRLPRLVGLARARGIILSGRHVRADEALAMGLVDQVLPAADVFPAAIEAAARFASGPVLAFRAAKMALNAAAHGDQARGLALEREVFRDLFASEDQKEGMRAFLEKRAPVFKGR